jgi:hypothetical protein
MTLAGCFFRFAWSQAGPIPLYAKWRLRDNARDIDVNALSDKMIGLEESEAIASLYRRLTLT